jgi:hypothetical protein
MTNGPAHYKHRRNGHGATTTPTPQTMTVALNSNNYYYANNIVTVVVNAASIIITFIMITIGFGLAIVTAVVGRCALTTTPKRDASLQGAPVLTATTAGNRIKNRSQNSRI